MFRSKLHQTYYTHTYTYSYSQLSVHVFIVYVCSTARSALWYSQQINKPTNKPNKQNQPTKTIETELFV